MFSPPPLFAFPHRIVHFFFYQTCIALALLLLLCRHALHSPLLSSHCMYVCMLYLFRPTSLFEGKVGTGCNTFLPFVRSFTCSLFFFHRVPLWVWEPIPFALPCPCMFPCFFFFFSFAIIPKSFSPRQFNLELAPYPIRIISFSIYPFSVCSSPRLCLFSPLPPPHLFPFRVFRVYFLLSVFPLRMGLSKAWIKAEGVSESPSVVNSPSGPARALLTD